MPLPFLAQLLLGVGLMILGYLLMPKPKYRKPPSTEDLDDPTAESGRPIPVIFGSLMITSPNIMGYWDKESRHRKARKKKGGKK
jgi:hypothetical protein